jgi:hypothetical protein
VTQHPYPPESLTLRVHRAISWLGPVEKEVDDADVRFILLWIGFNSAYGSAVSAAINSERGDVVKHLGASIMEEQAPNAGRRGRDLTHE